MLVATKPVTWTLDPNRSRKTAESRHDTNSCFGKPKGSVKIITKNVCLIPLLTMRFSAETAHRVISSPPPPVAGIRVKFAVSAA